MTTPWDMVAYLILLQFLSGLVLLRDGAAARSATANLVIPCQLLLLSVFWLGWGGYSIDSWRYLMGFWEPFWNFDEDYLFWMTGWMLSRITLDPWPIKIMSAGGVLILGLAIVRFHRQHAQWTQSLALFLLPILPAYFLTFGNALRQGLAAAAIIVGMLFLLRDRNRLFVLFVVAGFLCHQTSIAFAGALLAARFAPQGVVWALLGFPWASFVLALVTPWFGFELVDQVRYGYYSEGSFHYAKFLAAFAIACMILFATRDWRDPGRVIAVAYGYMVAISALFLKFEVPFERLLLYSDFLLPFVLPLMASRWAPTGWLRTGFWLAGILAGVAIWRHPSVTNTLGYL